MFQRLACLVPLLFSLSCLGQGMKISQYPNTNQVGPAQLFLITAGGTNMNVRGGQFASALAVVPNTNGFSTNGTHYFDQGPATAQFWIVDGGGTAHAVMGFDNTLDGVVVYDFVGGLAEYWMFTTNALTPQRVMRYSDIVAITNYDVVAAGTLVLSNTTASRILATDAQNIVTNLPANDSTWLFNAATNAALTNALSANSFSGTNIVNLNATNAQAATLSDYPALSVLGTNATSSNIFEVIGADNRALLSVIPGGYRGSNFSTLRVDGPIEVNYGNTNGRWRLTSRQMGAGITAVALMEPVNTNWAMALDISPSKSSAPNAGDVSWIDVVDRNLTAPGITTYWGTRVATIATASGICYSQFGLIWSGTITTNPTVVMGLGPSTATRTDVQYWRTNETVIFRPLSVTHEVIASNLLSTNGLSFMDGTAAADATTTNITLLASKHSVTIGTSNVNIAAIMQGVLGRVEHLSVLVTNGTGADWGIGFSSVTNAWKWDLAKAAPSVLTNGTQLEIRARVNGSNVLASYAYYLWP